MEYRLTKLSEGLWGITEGMVHCYLIEGNKKALLLDSCLSGGESFRESVLSLTTKPIQLVLTHSDHDHTGGQDIFPTVTMHPSELHLYTSKGNDERRARLLWEGHVFDLGGMELEVILIPGHTPGSIALIDRKNRRLFAGDSVSDQWVYLFGAGRSLKAYIESMRKLEGMTSFFSAVYCCHGSMVLNTSWVSKMEAAAEKLLAGELIGSDPPREMPARRYFYEGVNLLY